MAVTFHAANTTNHKHSGSGNYDVHIPSGTDQGDLVIVIIFQSEGDPNKITVNSNTGLTQLGTSFNGGWPGGAKVFYKYAENDEDDDGGSGGYYRLTIDDNATNMKATCLVFRDTTGGSSAEVTVNPTWNGSTSNTTSHVAPTINMPVTNTMLVSAFMSTWSGSNASYSVPTGMTERSDSAGPSTYCGMATDTQTISASGLTGTRTAVCTKTTGFVAMSLGLASSASTRTGSGTATLTLTNSGDGGPDIFTKLHQKTTARITLTTTTDVTAFKSATGAATASLTLGVTRTGKKISEGTQPAVILLDTYGTGFNPAPIRAYVPLRPPAPDPQPRLGMRYIVQNALTREIMSWDLPLNNAQLGRTLSGPGTLSGTLEPEIAKDITSGTNKILEAWGTLIHAEENGQIRASGILLPSEFSARSWDIVAEGFTTYPTGIPYDSEFIKENIDPIDIVREIWRYAQSFPNSNLKVAVDKDASSTVRLGVEREATRQETTTNPDGTTTTKEVPGPIIPYSLVWWDNKDCGTEIDNLAQSTPFDYREVSAWNADMTDIDMALNIGYPRLGRFRDDLRFVQGENILNTVVVGEADDWYASHVIGLGAGEGRERVREASIGRYEGLLGRLRRVKTYQNKRITNKGQLKALADDELKRRLAVHGISTIVVDGRHPNALLGSWMEGDDITVRAEVPWLGEVSIKHRIVSFTHDRDTDLVSLSLKRTDAFRYGNEREDVTS